MLKAKMNDGAYLLGITKENINRLKKDMPIKINLKDLNGPDIEIIIIYGEYESVILNQLQKAGMITENTKKNIT